MVIGVDFLMATDSVLCRGFSFFPRLRRIKPIWSPMFRLLKALAILAMFVCGSARAVDERDNGIYLIVNTNGEMTTKSFRLSQREGEWLVEDKRPDGSWVAVSCESDCKLMVSSESDVQRFFPQSALSQITPDCIHSKAFAFCGYSLKRDPNFRGYAFVAFTEGQPIALRLARVVPDKKIGS